MEKERRRHLSHNAVSYFGGLIALVSLLLILFFLLLTFSLRLPSPYIGIFTYLIFPAFFTLGVLVYLYGLRRESRRRRRLGREDVRPYPILDLNAPRQRRRFTLAMAGGSLLFIFLAFLGYNAFLFTDSVTFCGRICHQVMDPEYTSYLSGPHARVPCVECHVGSGVSWFVRSKISGVPQVFATLLRSYPRPIPTPIRNLRPARETCERCHWPQKFFGAQLVQIPYFRYDEKNTAEQISLLMKTGGGSERLGENAGIHWHMVIQHQVYFKAVDPARNQIPWVKLVLADGTEIVYRDEESKISEAELEKIPPNLMDCIDCHNRPAHRFLPPETAVHRAMAGGKIPSSLPWIKKVALESLVANYPDGAGAEQGIRQAIEGYYAKNHPQVFRRNKAQIDQAVEGVRSIYRENVFPGMRVDWSTYPNHIGHRNWPGCFSCHWGSHVSRTGKRITSSCTACHTEAQRGPLTPLREAALTGTDPWHPFPLRGRHEKILCRRCHQAGHPPPPDCASCHRLDRSAPMGSMDCASCHLRPQEVRPQADCASCHRARPGLHRHAAHAASPCTTCHPPHSWRVAGREPCLSCHGGKKDHHAPAACGACHPFGG